MDDDGAYDGNCMYDETKKRVGDPAVLARPLFLVHLLREIVQPTVWEHHYLHAAVENVILAIEKGDEALREAAALQVRAFRHRGAGGKLGADAAAYAALAFGPDAKFIAACACAHAAAQEAEYLKRSDKSHQDESRVIEASWAKIIGLSIKTLH
jgi:hypothetical protein